MRSTGGGLDYLGEWVDICPKCMVKVLHGEKVKDLCQLLLGRGKKIEESTEKKEALDSIPDISEKYRTFKFSDNDDHINFTNQVRKSFECNKHLSFKDVLDIYCTFGGSINDAIPAEWSKIGWYDYPKMMYELNQFDLCVYLRIEQPDKIVK